MVLAKPGNPIVRAELTEAEADRLAIGLKATVQLKERMARACPAHSQISLRPRAA